MGGMMTQIRRRAAAFLTVFILMLTAFTPSLAMAEVLDSSEDPIALEVPVLIRA